jgi:hypothetical protein
MHKLKNGKMLPLLLLLLPPLLLLHPLQSSSRYPDIQITVAC